MTRRVLMTLLGAVLTVTGFVLVCAAVLHGTLFSPGYFYRQMQHSGFVQQTAEDLQHLAVSYAAASGFDAEVLQPLAEESVVRQAVLARLEGVQNGEDFDYEPVALYAADLLRQDLDARPSAHRGDRSWDSAPVRELAGRVSRRHPPAAAGADAAHPHPAARSDPSGIGSDRAGAVRCAGGAAGAGRTQPPCGSLHRLRLDRYGHAVRRAAHHRAGQRRAAAGVHQSRTGAPIGGIVRVGRAARLLSGGGALRGAGRGGLAVECPHLFAQKTDRAPRSLTDVSKCKKGQSLRHNRRALCPFFVSAQNKSRRSFREQRLQLHVAFLKITERG